MVAALLGILKVGGTFLPLDPENPVQRTATILEDSKARLIICQKASEISFDFEFDILEIDSRKVKKSVVSSRFMDSQETVNPAYIIYTSGSTGRPKGVAVSHRGVLNFVQAMIERVNFSVGQSVLAITTICFDIFVLEVILPLLNGMKIVLADDSQQRDPDSILRLVSKQKVDIIQTTPSLWALLLQNSQAKYALARVKKILVGGELFPESLLADMQTIASGEIYNCYGPTETTGWSVVGRLDGAILRCLCSMRVETLFLMGLKESCGLQATD